jgi:hypothetical protein
MDAAEDCVLSMAAAKPGVLVSAPAIRPTTSGVFKPKIYLQITPVIQADPIINKVKKSRLQKRSRWYKSYINDIDTISIDDAKHPLATVVAMAKTLPVEDYTKMFGDKDLQEIIEDKKRAATEWKNDSNTLLIDFPGISSFTYNSIYNSLKNDLIISAWKYIECSIWFKTIKSHIS